MKMKSLKILNLVMAIVYTILISLIALTGIIDGDGEVFVGAIILSGAVVANWISYCSLRKVKEAKAEEVEYVEVIKK